MRFHFIRQMTATTTTMVVVCFINDGDEYWEGAEFEFLYPRQAIERKMFWDGEKIEIVKQSRVKYTHKEKKTIEKKDMR